MLAAMKAAHQQTFSVADMIMNPELRNFGVDAGEWNAPFHEYEDGAVELSIQKFISRRKIELISKDEKAIPGSFYVGLQRNMYGGSYKDPVAVRVTSGLAKLDQAQKNELNFYTLGYDFKTGTISENFFVSTVTSMNSKDVFSILWMSTSILNTLCSARNERLAEDARLSRTPVLDPSGSRGRLKIASCYFYRTLTIGFKSRTLQK